MILAQLALGACDGTKESIAIDPARDASSEPPGNVGCGLATCSSLGAVCGPIPDGCGAVVYCGTCPTGLTCGAAGPNRCGILPADASLEVAPDSCVPKTCTDLGVECSTALDGCGSQLDCGQCAKPNKCETGKCVCTPKTITCGTPEFPCGPFDNGCGYAVDCGACLPCTPGSPCTDSSTCISSGLWNEQCQCTGQGCAECESCQNGTCVTATDGTRPAGKATSEVCCGGKLVDISTDVHNCGGCGSACSGSNSCENVSQTVNCSSHPDNTSARCRCTADDECPVGQNCRLGFPEGTYNHRCSPKAADQCALGEVRWIPPSGEECPRYCYYP